MHKLGMLWPSAHSDNASTRRKMRLWSIWIGTHQQGKEAIGISSSALHGGPNAVVPTLWNNSLNIWCQIFVKLEM
ncbi:hypothetical protein QUC31_002154 [Theobroma cacao]